jgi:hypothetical protein
MSSQGCIAPETNEEREARRAKREAEAKSRFDYRWGNYQREHLNGGNNNARVVDWSKL